MLLHKQAVNLVDLLVEAVAPLKLVKLFRATSLVDAVYGTLEEALGFCGGDHTLELALGLRALEAGVTRVPELALLCWFELRHGITRAKPRKMTCSSRLCSGVYS